MATATAYVGVNMNLAQIWDGYVNVQTSSQLQIVSGGYVQNYYGNFYYNALGLAGGTLTSTNYYEFGTKIYEITGLNLSALTVESYIDAEDVNGLFNYAFSGNDLFNGSSQNDTLNGYGGSDQLLGNGGNDVLYGGGGNDSLNGGIGVDTMVGDLGNDTYYVDNTADVVSETSSAGGTDTIVSSVSRVLGLNQEHLTLSGTVAINATGNGLANTLTGNAAANVLNGGVGVDTMLGGLGNDTYYVDNTADVVSETSSTGGIDTIVSSVSRALGLNQEHLTLSGAVAINATGNGLANTLTGNAAANVLNGGVGVDTMLGGLGNDTYYVDNTADVVSETSSAGGTDTIVSSVSRVLGLNQEHLTLSGTVAINATGNGLANTLTGNAGNNLLDGGAGNDTLSGGAGNDRLTGGAGKDSLTGGAGNDIFAFGNLADLGLTSTTWDVISDFTRGADRIDLSALDANTATTTNDAFTAVIGSASAFTAAGQLKFASGVLYGNTDADATAEFAIQLVGVTAVSTADFVV